MTEKISLRFNFMPRVSSQATLLFIDMLFTADRGFVADVMQLLDRKGYPTSVLEELVKTRHVYVHRGRHEVLISSYYLHNDSLPISEIYKSPYYCYWVNDIGFAANRFIIKKPHNRLCTVEDLSGSGIKYRSNRNEYRPPLDNEIYKPGSAIPTTDGIQYK